MKKISKGFGLAAGYFIMAAVFLTACGKEGKSETMIITGGQEFVYAPHSGGETRTAPFTATVGEGEHTQVLTDVVWKILSSSQGASIDEEGVVTITDTYVAGDINGTDIVIQASVGGESAEEGMTATTTLHVRESQRAAAFEILLPESVKVGETVDISLTGWKDQYGEPMEAFDGQVQWEFSDKKLSVEDGKLVVNTRSAAELFAAVYATVDGLTVEKRFIISNRADYQPDAAAMERLALAKLTPVREIDFTQARQVDRAAYVYVQEDLAGKTELTVDVTGMVNAGANTDYQVTVRHGDGSVTTEDRKADGDGKIKLTLQNAEAVEVSPVLRFSLGECELDETRGYLQVAEDDKYTGKELCGFYGEVANTAGGISMRGMTNYFVTALPDGFYNIRITKPKSGTGRSTVKINDASVGTNVGNPGTGGRTGITPYTYLMEDVRVEGGTARISLEEKDFTLAAVEIRKTPEIISRRVHIYLGGDSTVSNYYPIEETEPQPGRFQTGWGQVFCQYVTEENAVTNLAGGGTYAKSWYETAFPGVIQNGQPGDYFLIQAGINDRSYSNEKEMVEYLTYMIDACREKGIIVILATAMQTPKFWKDKNGNELGEYGTPEGSGLASYMEAIRQLAADKEVFLVDTGKLTGEWYGKVGRTYVMQNYHLYNQETAVEEDTLHLSYHGALKVAELITTSLARMQAEGVTDGLGNTLDGLVFQEITAYEVVCKDASGREITIPVSGVGAVYRKYAQ